MRSELVPDRAPDLDTYFAEQGRSPARYTGQLDPNFQLALEKRYRSVEEPDCAFPQTVQLPGGRVVHGDRDWRGHEHEYLGNVPLFGRRVLLYGSASGWIASYIAARAADLVVVDWPPGESPPLVMRGGKTPDTVRQATADQYERLRRGFWFTKRQLDFAATVVYAPFSDLPADIGRIDVAILPFILSLTPDPYQVLKRAAAVTEEAIVVTDILGPVALGDGASQVAVAVFAPSPLPAGLVHWWQLAPYTVCEMAATLDLTEPTVRQHGLADAAPVSLFYTVVARRPPGEPAPQPNERTAALLPFRPIPGAA